MDRDHVETDEETQHQPHTPLPRYARQVVYDAMTKGSGGCVGGRAAG